jgi:hypothetical protein
VRLLPGSCRSNRPAAGSCPVPARLLLLPGSCPAPARFLPGSCLAGSWPVPGRFLAGSWPVPGRFLAGFWPVPGRFLPSGRFLPGSCPVPRAQRPAASWPVPGRFLAGSCPTAGQHPPRSGGCCAGAGHGVGQHNPQPAAPLRAGTLSLSGHGCCTTLVALCADASCTALFGDIGKFQDKAR